VFIVTFSNISAIYLTTGLNTKYLRKAQSYNKLTRPMKPQVSGNIKTWHRYQSINLRQWC